MEITVTSTEMIKPSSPTPPHLRHLNLSLIDQHMPPISYVRVLLFFPSQREPNTLIRLKESLSQALTMFYPLAGTFCDNKTIECDDRGLHYTEAQVRAPVTLRRIMDYPNVKELEGLVPSDAYSYGTGFEGLSAAQVTVFEECGGITIGVSVSHVLGDASSLAMFVDGWAAIARGDGDAMVSPKFGFASLFPPRDVPAFMAGHNQEAAGSGPKLVARRFVFDKTKIDALKANYPRRCSRVEAVSMLIFKCINSCKSMSSTASSLAMGLNLRGKTTPPLPPHCFGNLALPWMSEPGDSLVELGEQFWKSARDYDSEYLKTLLADNGSLLFEILDQHSKAGARGDVRFTSLTSWCGLPFYKVDFGWGAPVWATPVYSCFQDFVMLMDAKSDGEIEAWVTLEEGDMKEFEANIETVDLNGSSLTRRHNLYSQY